MRSRFGSPAALAVGDTYRGLRLRAAVVDPERKRAVIDGDEGTSPVYRREHAVVELEALGAREPIQRLVIVTPHVVREDVAPLWMERR